MSLGRQLLPLLLVLAAELGLDAALPSSPSLLLLAPIAADCAAAGEVPASSIPSRSAMVMRTGRPSLPLLLLRLLLALDALLAWP